MNFYLWPASQPTGGRFFTPDTGKGIVQAAPSRQADGPKESSLLNPEAGITRQRRTHSLLTLTGMVNGDSGANCQSEENDIRPHEPGRNRDARTGQEDVQQDAREHPERECRSSAPQRREGRTVGWVGLICAGHWQHSSTRPLGIANHLITQPAMQSFLRRNRRANPFDLGPLPPPVGLPTYPSFIQRRLQNSPAGV